MPLQIDSLRRGDGIGRADGEDGKLLLKEYLFFPILKQVNPASYVNLIGRA